MTAKLKYISDLPLYQEEKPFTLYGFPDDIVPQSNCHFETRDDVRVNNARGREADFTLDNCGFEFHTAPSKCRLTAHVFENHSEREAVWQYLKETIDFTQHHLQATKALCFDWRFRRSGADCGVNGQLNDLENARYRALAPATLMHCDFSFQGGLETLEIHLSDEEFQELADGRARMKIINVWRPLAVVQHSPLILCDQSSVDINDLLETDQVAPTKVELSMSLVHRKAQRNWWLLNQTPDEITMFTSWDSQRRKDFPSHTPHGACLNAPLEINARARESVEVRLIVIWKND